MKVRTSTSAVAAAVALAAILSACGNSSKNASSSSSTTTAPRPAGADGSPGGGSFPGAFGSVAAITGDSMEVQNQQTGQTTVNWTSTTRFTKTATLSAASLTPGQCVTVVGTSSGATITARSVTITQPSSSGSCTAQRGGLFGGGGTFRRSSSGSVPVSRPAGSGAGARFAGGSFAGGKIVSASTTSMVIDGTTFSFAGRTTSSTSAPPTTTAPSDMTVDLSSSTTYSETQSTTSSSLAVGDCITATGSTDSTGAVTAAIIRITSTGGQSCTAGFGRFGGGSSSGGGVG